MSLDVISILIFVATMIERVIEIFVSQKNTQWSLSRGGVEYGANHYKWMVLMHASFFVCMVTEYLIFGNNLPPFVHVLAILLAVFCQGLRWWIIVTLGRQWNTRVIVVPGLDRIRIGPFQYVDHPNYIVVAAEIFILPLIFGSWRTSLVFSILNAQMMRIRLGVENQALKELR